MSKEYIEKEAAIRNFCKGCGLFDTDNCICTGKVRCDEYDAILDTPPADVVARDCFNSILAQNDIMREQLVSIGKCITEDMSDVARVVRCGDCKHYKDGWCYNPNTYDNEKTRGNTSPNWYCADGKRRK